MANSSPSSTPLHSPPLLDSTPRLTPITGCTGDAAMHARQGEEGQQGRSKPVELEFRAHAIHLHARIRRGKNPRSHQPAISTSTAARYFDSIPAMCTEHNVPIPLLPLLPSFHTQGYLCPLYLHPKKPTPPAVFRPPICTLHSKAPKQVGRSALPPRTNSCAIHPPDQAARS